MVVDGSDSATSPFFSTVVRGAVVAVVAVGDDVDVGSVVSVCVVGVVSCAQSVWFICLGV